MRWFTRLSEEAQVVLCMAALTVLPLIATVVGVTGIVVGMTVIEVVRTLWPNGING